MTQQRIGGFPRFKRPAPKPVEEPEAKAVESESCAQNVILDSPFHSAEPIDEEFMGDDDDNFVPTPTDLPEIEIPEGGDHDDHDGQYDEDGRRLISEPLVPMPRQAPTVLYPEPAPRVDKSVRQRLTLGDIRRANPPFIPGRIR